MSGVASVYNNTVDLLFCGILAMKVRTDIARVHFGEEVGDVRSLGSASFLTVY